MRCIWKYKLAIMDSQSIEVPRGFRVPLTVQMQDGIPYLWCNVDPEDKERITRYIYCVGTGDRIPERALQYISTIQEGPYVWHWFWGV